MVTNMTARRIVGRTTGRRGRPHPILASCDPSALKPTTHTSNNRFHDTGMYVIFCFIMQHAGRTCFVKHPVCQLRRHIVSSRVDHLFVSISLLLWTIRLHPFSRPVSTHIVAVQVGLVLNNSQIANINKMRSTLRDLERWEALYRHRPKHKIKDGPKAW